MGSRRTDHGGGSPRADPARGIRRLVVDADNLLGALPRSRTGLSAPTLLARLRAIVPSGAVVELVFDGPPSRGSGRPGPGLLARYAAPRSADEVIVDLVRAAGVPAPGDDPSVLVVTDDLALRRAVRDLGAATAGTAWLIARAERTRLGGPSVGRPGPPVQPSPGSDDARRWSPGRGATVKRGNARRARRDRGTSGTPG